MNRDFIEPAQTEWKKAPSLIQGSQKGAAELRSARTGPFDCAQGRLRPVPARPYFWATRALALPSSGRSEFDPAQTFTSCA